VLLSRSFKISLLLSTLIHLGAFIALGHEAVTSKVMTSPKPLLARTSPPKVVRFELVETPDSAKLAESPKNANLFSDKNTRAQDMFQGDKKLKDAPRMEGKHEDSKDTRQRATVVAPPEPPAKKPEPAEEPDRRETERPAPEQAKEEVPEKPVEPKEPEEKILFAAEPVKKEVVQLAKKEPVAAMPPTMSPPAMIMSAASSKNADADAQITGELSFAASRHFFGEYLLKMKQQIERQWISRLVSRYTGVKSSQAVIDFKIQPDGSISDVVINSSEGDPYFPVLCVTSIHDAQPFDKIPYADIDGLPQDFSNKPLNIRFTFRYN